MMIRHVIFDLDGTLIDSKEDIKTSLEIAFSAIGRRRIHIDTSCIGLPLREIARFLDSSITEEDYATFQNAFRADYDNRELAATRLMDGAIDALEALAASGIHTYVATAKPSVPCERIMSKLGISSYFKSARSMDSLVGNNRTKDELLSRIMVEEAVDPGESAYVGDYPSDIYAARKCKMKAIAYLGGYGNANALLDAEPDICVRRISEIPSAILDERKA